MHKPAPLGLTVRLLFVPRGKIIKIKNTKNKKIQNKKKKKRQGKKPPCENGPFGLEDMAHCLYDSPLPMMVMDI
jgi:hypothetical protein